MGYRSDVAIAVYGDNKIALAQTKSFFEGALAALSDDGKLDAQALIEKSVVRTGKPIWNEQGEMFFYVEHVKWYDGYPAVDFFEDVAEYARDLELSVEFVRIGEELEDNFEWYDNVQSCRLQLARTISFDI